MENKKQGYVYILTNPSFKEDWVKIGKTTNMEERLKTLYNTSLPLPFEVFATMKTTKYNEAERLIHHYIERFTNLRIDKKREFFNVKPEDALAIFKDVALVLDDAVIEEAYKQDIIGTNQEKPIKSSENNGENRVWLIPSNQRVFDLHACLKKYGQVYWSQYFNFRPGDTGYIYSSNPDSCIKYSFVVDKAELKYSDILDIKTEHFINQEDFEEWKAHNRFALFRITGTTNSSRLNLAHLMSHGLKIAPRGALNLSYKDYAELKKYIEENF